MRPNQTVNTLQKANEFKLANELIIKTVNAAVKRAFEAQTKPKCSHCDRNGHLVDKCWLKHPELRPSKRQKKE